MDDDVATGVGAEQAHPAVGVLPPHPPGHHHNPLPHHSGTKLTAAKATTPHPAGRRARRVGSGHGDRAPGGEVAGELLPPAGVEADPERVRASLTSFRTCVTGRPCWVRASPRSIVAA